MLRKGRFFLVFIVCYPILSASAVVCEDNQYTDGEFCYTCPANATCDGTDFVCNDGWYENGTMCEKCSIENSTCSGADDYSCLSGFYDDGKACNACPENATCAGGHEYFYCKAGYYKYSYGDLLPICLSCAGHVCEGENLISCGENFYLHGRKYCEKCTANQYCPAGTRSIVCNEGYYVDANGACKPCPEGYFCPLAESKVNLNNIRDHCAKGYYRTGNTCTKCDDGMVCPGGKIVDIVCPDGLYKHDNGTCLEYQQGNCGSLPNCNPGCYDNDTECVKCPVENSTCTNENDFLCMAGYYNNGSYCAECPLNSTCPVGSIQISCLPGYWLDGNLCSNCGTSQYCHDNIRYNCPEYTDGILKPAPPSGHRFISYNRTYTYNPPNATDITDCYLLGPIRFAAPEGEYIIRSSGRYNGSQYAISYVNKYWSVANSGYYLDNRYTADTSVTTYLDIKQCTNGAENSYYTGAGSPGGNDCPWVCNDGFYRDGNFCLLCPEGMECVGGGIICPAGMYADKNKCITCPDGYTDSQDTGAQSINACQIKCAGGSYVSTPNSTSCNNVGAGYWIGENYTNYGATGVRNACAGGMTTVGYGTGADEASDCGRILHIGDKKVYLRSAKQTSPSLVIKYLDTLLYGDLTTENKGSIKLNINNKIYSLYDSITQ